MSIDLILNPHKKTDVIVDENITLQVHAFKPAEVQSFLDCMTVIGKVLTKSDEASDLAFELLVEHYPETITIIALATGKKTDEEISELMQFDFDALLRILGVVLEVNAYFFARAAMRKAATPKANIPLPSLESLLQT